MLGILLVFRYMMEHMASKALHLSIYISPLFDCFESFDASVSQCIMSLVKITEMYDNYRNTNLEIHAARTHILRESSSLQAQKLEAINLSIEKLPLPDIQNQRGKRLWDANFDTISLFTVPTNTFEIKCRRGCVLLGC